MQKKGVKHSNVLGPAHGSQDSLVSIFPHIGSLKLAMGEYLHRRNYQILEIKTFL